MGWGLGLLRNSAAVKSLIKRLNLPLEVTDDRIQEHLQEPGKAPPPSPYTQAYPAQGFFTGVRSRVVISQPAAVVYESLSHDLHNVFTPMTECDDTVEADDGAGGQTLFRIVRIPFKVMFVAGNLKLRLRVEQDSRTGQISFVSLKEGRLISHMVATFHISPAQGADGETHCLVELDAKVAIMPMFGRLAPGVFKDAVKGVMVHKMDCCMLDLIAYHSPQQPDRRSLQQKRRSFAAERRKGASGRSSRDFGRRRSLSSMLISPFAAVSGGVIEPRTPPHAGPAEDGCVGAHTGEAAQQPCGASQAVDLNDSAQCLAHSRRLVPSQQHRADSSPRKVPDSPIQGAANKPGHRSMARRGLHKVNKRVRGLF
ncbi:hypothetical protein WJX72_008625 [[Myrmecia] bisecta]|uniref:Coenzyme Q-binding protein COQ10 START domain-containing protein n=1 Tax=[Myrmecia] bisecta TaxID=41462 RepID=A0AAW1R8P7_9CHLO